MRLCNYLYEVFTIQLYYIVRFFMINDKHFEIIILFCFLTTHFHVTFSVNII